MLLSREGSFGVDLKLFKVLEYSSFRHDRQWNQTYCFLVQDMLFQFEYFLHADRIAECYKTESSFWKKKNKIQ